MTFNESRPLTRVLAANRVVRGRRCKASNPVAAVRRLICVNHHSSVHRWGSLFSCALTLLMTACALNGHQNPGSSKQFPHLFSQSEDALLRNQGDAGEKWYAAYMNHDLAETSSEFDSNISAGALLKHALKQMKNTVASNKAMYNGGIDPVPFESEDGRQVQMLERMLSSSQEDEHHPVEVVYDSGEGEFRRIRGWDEACVQAFEQAYAAHAESEISYWQAWDLFMDGVNAFDGCRGDQAFFMNTKTAVMQMVERFPPFSFFVPYVSDVPLSETYFIASRVLNVRMIQVGTVFSYETGRERSPVKVFFDNLKRAFVKAQNDLHWQMIPEKFGGYVRGPNESNQSDEKDRNGLRIPPFRPDDLPREDFAFASSVGLRECSPVMQSGWWQCWYDNAGNPSQPTSQGWLQTRLIDATTYQRLQAHRRTRFDASFEAEMRRGNNETFPRHIEVLFQWFHAVHGAGFVVPPYAERQDLCLAAEQARSNPEGQGDDPNLMRFLPRVAEGSLSVLSGRRSDGGQGLVPFVYPHSGGGLARFRLDTDLGDR